MCTMNLLKKYLQGCPFFLSWHPLSGSSHWRDFPIVFHSTINPGMAKVIYFEAHLNLHLSSESWEPPLCTLSQR